MGQYQSDGIVFHMQVPDHNNIGRYHSAVEQGSKVEEKGKFVSPREVFPEQDICRHWGNKQSYGRSQSCHQDGNSIGPNDLFRR